MAQVDGCATPSCANPTKKIPQRCLRRKLCKTVEIPVAENSIDRIKLHRDKTICSDLVDNRPRCAKCKIRYICVGSCRAEQSFIYKNKYSYLQCQLQNANIKFFLESVEK